MAGGWYKISEFSRLTGISRNTVKSMIDHGEIETEEVFISGKRKKVIPEKVFFKHFKLLRNDQTGLPITDMPIQEILIRIATVMYDLSEKSDERYKEVYGFLNRMLRPDGCVSDNTVFESVLEEKIRSIVREEIVNLQKMKKK